MRMTARCCLLPDAVLLAPTAFAQNRAGRRVNNLKVLSDKIDDVTTPENILKSFLKPVMSDADRAKALWTPAVKYRHQFSPPTEELCGEWERVGFRYRLH